MDYGTFTKRFREEQEIGRDITDTELAVFRDNGAEVGVWRENRGTTEGKGGILSPDNARRWRAHWFWSEAVRTRTVSREVAHHPDASSRATKKSAVGKGGGRPFPGIPPTRELLYQSIVRHQSSTKFSTGSLTGSNFTFVTIGSLSPANARAASLTHNVRC